MRRGELTQNYQWQIIITPANNFLITHSRNMRHEFRCGMSRTQADRRLFISCNVHNNNKRIKYATKGEK